MADVDRGNFSITVKVLQGLQQWHQSCNYRYEVYEVANGFLRKLCVDT
jgi:hypothetical protein